MYLAAGGVPARLRKGTLTELSHFLWITLKTFIRLIYTSVATFVLATKRTHSYFSTGKYRAGKRGVAKVVEVPRRSDFKGSRVAMTSRQRNAGCHECRMFPLMGNVALAVPPEPTARAQMVKY